MTTTYNKTSVYSFNELSEVQQKWVMDTYFDENSDAQDTGYVILNSCENEPLPLSMFMKTEKANNFTHGIYSTSAFDGYFLTFSRDNSIAVIAHKYF